MRGAVHGRVVALVTPRSRGRGSLSVPPRDGVHLPGTTLKVTRKSSQGKEEGWASAGTCALVRCTRARSGSRGVKRARRGGSILRMIRKDIGELFNGSFSFTDDLND